VLKFLLVVILVAIAVYLATRALQTRGTGPAPRRTQGGIQGRIQDRIQRHQQPPRVIGPDDDPDFLRDLDRRRRHPEDPEA
jgi:hypothetical protein